MIPKDEEEAQIIQCFTLSIKGGMNGIEVEYLVVKDFSKKYALDSIDLYQIIKSMTGAFSKDG
ncbi:MAG: hypothetical protein PHV62_08000 [Sulfuricurvum sp.]|nr:hypothetical protein [Sulfuricurvum sp.]